MNDYPKRPPKRHKGTEHAEKIENSPFVKASKKIAEAPVTLAKGADKVNKFAKALKKRLS